MHYLNILTIRIYTLLSVLSTRLPDWLQHGMSFVAIPIQYGNNDWNKINQMSMNSLYDSKYRPVADFYISFSKYLNTTRPIYAWLSFVGGHILKWLYELLNMLLRVYASMFSIFGDVTGSDHVRYWFKMIQHIGWVAFGILLVIYGFGMIFNLKGGFARMKDFIVGAMLAIFVVAVLPSLTSGFTTGMQKVASNMLGVSDQVTMNESTKKDNTPHSNNADIMNPADSVVRNNVISIPMMTNYYAVHGKNTINMSNNHVFQRNSSNFSDYVPIQPYSINLYHMSDGERNIWNGIGDTNIVDFLNQIGGDGYYLNKQTVDSDSKLMDNNLGKSDFYNGANTAEHHSPLISSTITNSMQHVFNFPTRNAENYKDFGARLYAPYMHQVTGSGTEARVYRLDQFNTSQSSGFGMFNSSYPKYHIAWFNILVGLLSLAWVLFGLLFKLTNSFFKMVVMYVTSGWFLMKNSADHNKIKDFIRTFFGIFENLIIDLVVLRLFLDVYLDLMGTLETVPHLSPLAIAIIQPLITIGLLKVQTKGIDTLSSQMSGSNTQSGNGIGAMGAAAIGYGALRSAGRHGGNMAKKTAKGAGIGTAAGFHYGRGVLGGWQNSMAKRTGKSPGHPIQGLKKRLHQAGGNANTTEYPGSPGGSNNSNTSQRGKSDSNNNSSNNDQNMNASTQGKNNDNLNQQPNGGGNGTGNNGDQDTFDNGNPISQKPIPNSRAERAGRFAGYFGRNLLLSLTAPLNRMGKQGNSPNQDDNIKNADNMKEHHGNITGGHHKGIPSGHEGPNDRTGNDDGPIIEGGPTNDPKNNGNDDDDGPIPINGHEKTNHVNNHNNHQRHHYYNRNKKNSHHRFNHKNDSGYHNHNQNDYYNLKRRKGHNGRNN